MNPANSEDSRPPKYSFEEYRMVYESAERVTDRRTGLNRSNYAICIGMVVAASVVANWAIQNTEYFLWGVGVIAVLGVLGVLFSIGWILQITDYKNLNSAKFQVLEEMSEFVSFEDNDTAYATSYRPFKREWEIMKEKDGALTSFWIRNGSRCH